MEKSYENGEDKSIERPIIGDEFRNARWIVSIP